MELRELGTTGIKLSPLGLGTVKFGRNEGIKYPTAFELPEESDLADLLTRAKELGINTLDTAPAYGLSEERLGRLLCGQREDWVIIGKAGEEYQDGNSRYNFSPGYLEMSLECSLERLNTDYIDIFLIHSDGDDLPNLSDDVIRAMQDFKRRGLVRAIGASTKTAEGGMRALEFMDTVMATYTPNYTAEKDVLDFATTHGKGVLLKKALSSGYNTNIEDVFRFCFAHPAVTSAVVGTINPEHLRGNAEILNAILRSPPEELRE